MANTTIIRKSAPRPPSKTAADSAPVEKARLLSAARADVALVVKRKSEISRAFYDIGKALTRLRCDPIPKLLGYSTFGKLCREGVGISLATAEKLIHIVERVSQRNALRWGKEKAAALVDLANAAGGSGRITRRAFPFDPDSATTRDIRAEAKRQRARAASRTLRGRATTASERNIAQRLERSVRAAGFATARVAAIAGAPGKPASLRIDRLPFDALAALRKALSKFG